jgi:hypothetical protein
MKASLVWLTLVDLEGVGREVSIGSHSKAVSHGALLFREFFAPFDIT